MIRQASLTKHAGKNEHKKPLSVIVAINIMIMELCDLQVYISDTPDMKVYVQSYGGWMTGITDANQATKLHSALNSAGLKYKDFHYAVGYNR